MATRNNKSKSFQWNYVCNQYYAAFTANLIMFSQGSMQGWASPALAILSSEKTPLSTGPLTNDQISWIGSVNNIGGILGSFLFGYIASKIGSKRALFFVSFPSIAFWLIIHFGSIYYHIFAARFIGGLSGGAINTCVILFVAEIANDDIRGRLGSVSQFMRNVGILVAYILGSTLDYQYIPSVCIFLPIIFMILFFMLPNSPQYFLLRGHTEKAEKALKYYKGYEGNNDEEICTFEGLISTATDRKIEEDKLQASDFFNRAALKGLGIGIALSFICQISGNFLIISYSVLIFAKAGTTIDPYVSSIYSAVALIFGSILSTYLADILGRKILNLISLMGSAIGFFSMALHYYLHINGYDLTEFQWVPVVSVSFVIFITSAGIASLQIVCSIEYLPAKIRTIGTAIISVAISLAAFVTSKLFPILLEIVDLHGCMITLGIGCIIGFLFVLVVMRETAGQPLDDIGMDEKETKKYEFVHE